MQINLKNKNYIVTGGSRGIGEGIVKELVKCGANVAFTYNTGEDRARKIVDGLKVYDSIVKVYKLDLKDFDSIPQFVEDVYKDFDVIDGIVNNAGLTRDNIFSDMSASDWNEVLNANLNSIFYLSKAILPKFLDAFGGNIINMSSVSGFISMRGQANYSASKAALIAFTKTLAKEYAFADIRVNAIAPGYVETDMTRFSGEKIASLKKMIPFKRFGTVEEVAYVTAFMLSDYSSYITGQTIVVDGGISNSVV